ncbi:GNAT family N-acetyltransferase [Ruminococcus sp. XPD3002]|uniref:GNAT family N-acetyltransferase n=1 Tax=Ruminococcus sp. XPD3002 TaxID=1452269 RepID=UPI0009166C94|nr:Predicted N-acetyltransferase YhbS [Ruminococcus flavefaciens]HPY83782.1 GNAT family N-acetyltransferase [Ruminococcus flavefaciens]
MELKIITPSSADAEAMDVLNRQAFPDNERLDTDDLFLYAKEGELEILGIYTEEGFSGFLIMRPFEKIAYIAYFAVCPEKRCKGIGGKALAALREYYPERQIVVDFEALDADSPNNPQRIRRREFYYRNGFYPTGWYQFYMETEFEIACSGPVFDKESFDALLAAIHKAAPEFDPHPYRKD